jgi:hypothetical protein
MRATMSGEAKLLPGENVIVLPAVVPDENEYSVRTTFPKLIVVLERKKQCFHVRNDFDMPIFIKWKLIQKRNR